MVAGPLGVCDVAGAICVKMGLWLLGAVAVAVMFLALMALIGAGILK